MKSRRKLIQALLVMKLRKTMRKKMRKKLRKHQLFGDWKVRKSLQGAQEER